MNKSGWKGQSEVQGLLLTFAVAAAAFILLFTGLVFHFWLQMALTVLGLCFLAFWRNPQAMRNLFRRSWTDAWQAPVVGLLSAALLYGVFYAGGMIAERLFSGAGFWIADVYTLKTNVSPRLIALLLVGVIGPGEEIFWRGYLQTRLEEQYGLWGVVLTVGAYTAVHLPSGNPMFITAAAVCGVFWGLMFRYFRSLWANMISHAAWDAAIFVLWPIHVC